MPRIINGTTALVLVLDAIGIPTIEYILNNHKGSINLPNLASMGLGKLLDVKFQDRIRSSDDSFAVALEQASVSADSVIGHREMVGVIDTRSYNLFHQGFPKEYIHRLEERIRRRLIFNRMAGGDKAIELNYEEHEKTGHPIIYASICDPIAQIAMNEDTIPVEEQHRIAEIALNLATEMDLGMNRVISRAYTRHEGVIKRTENRHDATLPIEQKTLVDILKLQGVQTAAVAKVGDLIPGFYDKLKYTSKDELDEKLGLKFVHPERKDTNPYSAQATVKALLDAKEKERPKGSLILSNFVDTDALYGHPHNIEGIVKCLEEADRVIGIIQNSYLMLGDVIIVTADHGMKYKNDLGYIYGFHNKEPVPLLVRMKGYLRWPQEFTLRNSKTFASVGDLVSQIFRCSDRYIEECSLRDYFTHETGCE
ncbi:hypothetical protein HYU23_01165 [Candidatus Woesearchaeota archaeon]|nr:hypothetical protein [Candidatus Woesearchaeota archaeon]